MNDTQIQTTHTESGNGKDAERWTSRRLIAWMQGYFAKAKLDSPRLRAEWLLCHVLGCERMQLYMDADRPATADELLQLRGFVKRAGQQEPLEYLLGNAWFFALQLKVTPDTLIPRPCTETLVEFVIQECRKQTQTQIDQSDHSDAEACTSQQEDTEDIEDASAVPGVVADSADDVEDMECHRIWRIADIGTGSGAIAIALASNVAGAEIVATDISGAALAIAIENAAQLGVQDRITFCEGSLLEPLTGGNGVGNNAAVGDEKYDFIISNPPYISDAEWVDVPLMVREFEPTVALRSGVDGLSMIQHLIAEGPHFIRSGGYLILEIASSQESAVLALVRESELVDGAQILRDLEGHPRVLVCRRVCCGGRSY